MSERRIARRKDDRAARLGLRDRVSACSHTAPNRGAVRRRTPRWFPRQRLLPLLLVGAVAILTAACGAKISPKITGSTSSTTTSSTTTTTTAPKPTTKAALLYFTRGSGLGVARRTEPVAQYRFSALKALFAGPSSQEQSAGLGTAIPSGSVLAGLSFNGTLAYVDVNSKFLAAATTSQFTVRLAQVVYTLTGFFGVNSVQFYFHGSSLPDLNGIPTSRPLTRADLTKAIDGVLLESPAVNESLSGTVPISGMSAVTGTIQVQVLSSSGTAIIDTVTTATPGETFAFDYPLPNGSSGPATVRVFTAGPHGTSSQLVASIPVAIVGG